MSLQIRGSIQSASLQDLLHRTKGLKRNVRDKIVRPSVNKALDPVLSAAKALVRKRTGLLQKSLGKRLRQYRGTFVGITGPRTGSQTTGRGRKRKKKLSALGLKFKAAGVMPSKYAHLLEKGTRPHSLRKGSKLLRKGLNLLAKAGVRLGRWHPGARPYPFMRPAWLSQQAQVESVLTTQLTQRLEQEARA